MKPTILIVEDDPFIAMDLQDTFEDEGYEVMGPVAEKAEGMSLIADHMPDVAMLDYNLGGETSEDIARCLKKNSVPFVFLTGQIARVVDSEDLGSPKIIAKPFTPQLLIKEIGKLIENSFQ